MDIAFEELRRPLGRAIWALRVQLAADGVTSASVWRAIISSSLVGTTRRRTPLRRPPGARTRARLREVKVEQRLYYTEPGVRAVWARPAQQQWKCIMRHES